MHGIYSIIVMYSVAVTQAYVTISIVNIKLLLHKKEPQDLKLSSSRNVLKVLYVDSFIR